MFEKIDITDGIKVWKVIKLKEGLAIYVPKIVFMEWCMCLFAFAIGMTTTIALYQFGIM
jgi:hypothetical protein